MLFFKIGTPRYFYPFAKRLNPWLWLGAIFCLGYGLINALLLAPADYQQGEAYRIMFIHVPFAFASMGIYTTLAVCALIAFVWRVRLAYWSAQVLAPIGALFTALALITGSIWGKPMWGTWWIWDARLTSELLLLFIYWGYIGLTQAIPHSDMAMRLTSIYALIGLVNIPIIHFSVNWWFTLHQGQTVSRLGKPLMPASMWQPLLLMCIGVALYTAALVFMRLRQKILIEEQDKHWLKSLLGGSYGI